MKITVNRKNKNKQKELKFPCLMESTFFCDPHNGGIVVGGTVVLFTSECVGMVVECPSKIYAVGHHYKGWVSANESDSWKPFIGKVTLENETN